MIDNETLFEAADNLAAAMPDYVALPQGDAFVGLCLSTFPLWQELDRLGWADSFGGMEWARLFGPMIAHVYREANTLPDVAA